MKTKILLSSLLASSLFLTGCGSPTNDSIINPPGGGSDIEVPNLIPASSSAPTDPATATVMGAHTTPTPVASTELVDFYNNRESEYSLAYKVNGSEACSPYYIRCSSLPFIHQPLLKLNGDSNSANTFFQADIVEANQRAKLANAPEAWVAGYTGEGITAQWINGYSRHDGSSPKKHENYMTDPDDNDYLTHREPVRRILTATAIAPKTTWVHHRDNEPTLIHTDSDLYIANGYSAFLPDDYLNPQDSVNNHYIGIRTNKGVFNEDPDFEFNYVLGGEQKKVMIMDGTNAGLAALTMQKFPNSTPQGILQAVGEANGDATKALSPNFSD